MTNQEEEKELTFEFADISKEKYNLLEKLLHRYMDGKLSREAYVNKVEELLK